MKTDLVAKKSVMKKIVEDQGMKRLLIIGMFIFLASGTMAYYILSYQSPTITGQVINGVSSFVVTSDLTNFTIDVSSDLDNVQTIELLNENSEITMVYTLETNISNLDAIYCNNSGDLTFLLEGVNGTILPDDTFVMNAGTNSFNFTTSAISDKVCPAELLVTIYFQE